MAPRIFRDVHTQPTITEPVKAYLCLHRLKDVDNEFVEKAWSLKGKRSGLVLAHAKGILLHNCTFEVSEAGRQRTITQKKKYVHAYVCGTVNFRSGVPLHSDNEVEIFYNPYRMNSFQDINGRKIVSARLVLLDPCLAVGKKSRVTAIDPVFEVDSVNSIW